MEEEIASRGNVYIKQEPDDGWQEAPLDMEEEGSSRENIEQEPVDGWVDSSLETEEEIASQSNIRQDSVDSSNDSQQETQQELDSRPNIVIKLEPVDESEDTLLESDEASDTDVDGSYGQYDPGTEQAEWTVGTIDSGAETSDTWEPSHPDRVPHLQGTMHTAGQESLQYSYSYVPEGYSAGLSSPTDYSIINAGQVPYYLVRGGQIRMPTAYHQPPSKSSVYLPKKRGRKPLPNKGRKYRKHNRPGSHIKRAKTPYFHFLEEFRKNYVKEGEKVPRAKDITKACGAKWSMMSEEEKKPHVEKAKVDRERYDSEMAIYRKVRDPDKPKKPPTAYFYFLSDFRARMKGKSIEKGKRQTEICGKEWNKLTKDQKRPYVDRVAAEYKVYQEALRQWKQEKAAQASTTAGEDQSTVSSASPQPVAPQLSQHPLSSSSTKAETSLSANMANGKNSAIEAGQGTVAAPQSATVASSSANMATGEIPIIEAGQETAVAAEQSVTNRPISSSACPPR